MKRFWIVVMLSLLPTGLAVAQRATVGRDLYGYWKAYERVQSERSPSAADLADSGAYMGYVQGVSEALRDIDALSGVTTAFEIPASVPLSKVYAAVGRYLAAHPQLWGSPATWLVMQALESAYPRAPG